MRERESVRERECEGKRECEGERGEERWAERSQDAWEQNPISRRKLWRLPIRRLPI